MLESYVHICILMNENMCGMDATCYMSNVGSIYYTILAHCTADVHTVCYVDRMHLDILILYTV